MNAEITIIYYPKIKGFGWIPKVTPMSFFKAIASDAALERLFTDINTRLDELADQCKQEDKQND